MGLKAKVESNVVIWLLGALAAGFASGFGAYEAILKVAQRQVVPAEEYSRLLEISKAAQENTHRSGSSDQRWIRVSGIDFHKTGIDLYRIVFRVDGVPLSYPGHSVWKRNDPKTPKQDFPLSVKESDHHVLVKLYYIDSSGQEHEAEAPQEIVFSGSMSEASAQVYQHSFAGTVRGGTAVATINFQIRQK